jgi:pimeloyl-ACP methyl ester carboxylesterase
MQGMRLLMTWKWIVFLFLILVATSVAAEETPLEVYGRLPYLEDLALSPDGKYIAFTLTTAEDREVIILSLADLKIIDSLNIGKVKLRNTMWADNTHLLFETSITDLPEELTGAKAEFFMLRSYDIVTHKSNNPIHATSNFPVMNVIIGNPMIRNIGDQTLIYVEGIYITDRTMPALFKLNLSNGSAQMAEMGTRESCGWLVDENGMVIASQTYNETNRRWGLWIQKEGRLVETVSGLAEIEYPTITGFAPMGNSLWVRTLDQDELTWKSLSRETGILGEPVSEAKDFATVMSDPYTDRIIGGRPKQGESDFIFFDKQRQAIWKSVQSYFPGEHVDFISASRDFKKIAILVEGPKHGYTYLVADVAAGNFISVGNVYQNLTQIAEVRSFTYAAQDGMPIQAFLTLPIKRNARNLPLVVLPHGGPAASDTGRFDWWAQALAAQGYAVLQPNYRGSALGWKFKSAGFGEWGRKMQTDLSDGARQLIKDGIVDANRVCIVGASYGGYAALAGATLDAGIYRCSVSVAGISDLRKYLKWANSGQKKDSLEMRYWDRYYGASSPDDPVLKTLSPLIYAGEIAIPILLIHGRDDTVVPFEQSKLMADALKRLKKPVELVILKNEDHWLSRGDTRLQMLEATVKFLRENNPPD